jgi:hypothetical protein
MDDGANFGAEHVLVEVEGFGASPTEEKIRDRVHVVAPSPRHENCGAVI